MKVPVSVRRSIVRIAMFCAAFALLYVVIVRLAPGQEIDDNSFGALAALHGRFSGPANLFRAAASVLVLVAAVVLGIGALVRRRFRNALDAAAIVVASVVLSEVLKSVVLQRPHLGIEGYDQNTFPSGHVALALSAAVAVAVLLPTLRRCWPVLFLVVLIVAMISWTSIVSYAHRPSDVIGGSLVVGAVASTVFWGRRSTVGAHPAVVVAILGTTLAGGVLAVMGAQLQVAGVVWSTAISVPGWFIVCVVPVVGVFGLIPLTESRPTSESPLL